jgi:enoyl-CoA hydratase/carnithine racemase
MFSIAQHRSLAVIRYDHPPRNFLTLRAIVELRALWDQLERDKSVRVIAIAGPPGHFMLHVEPLELAAMLDAVPRVPRPLRVLFATAVRILGRWPWLLGRLLIGGLERTAALHVALLHRAIERTLKPTIAVIDGPCLGGGMELALCFDYRIASDAPEVHLGLPETRIGMIPGFGGTQRLARILGSSRALAVMMEGELVAAARAHELGLVTHLAPRARLWATVDEIADRLARRPAHALAAVKRAVRAGSTRGLDRGLSAELVEVAGIATRRDTRAAVHDYARRITEVLSRPVDEQPSLVELACELEAKA